MTAQVNVLHAWTVSEWFLCVDWLEALIDRFHCVTECAAQLIGWLADWPTDCHGLHWVACCVVDWSHWQLTDRKYCAIDWLYSMAHWPYCMPCWLCCVTHYHDTTGCSARLTAHYIVWLIDSTDWLIDWLYIAWLIDRSSWLTDCIAWLTLFVWPMIILRDCLNVPPDWRGLPGAWVCVALLTFFHVEAINNNYLCEYSE